MRRRQVLASVGAASLVAGCGGLLDTPCKPGGRELGALHQSVLEMNDPGRVSIRGTITRMQSVSIVVADGTGYAIVDAPFGKEFNTDWFEEGDCVEVTGSVLAGFSREFGHLELELDSAEDIESTGATDEPPEAPPEKPDAFFDVSYPDSGAELTHTGTEAVPAEHLEARHRPEQDLTVYPWHEFAGVDPDTEVEPGDTAVFPHSGDGHLVWRPMDHWGQAISSGWEL